MKGFFNLLCVSMPLLAISVFGAGCKTHSAYEVQVQLADTLVPNAQNVEVDLVAVSKANFSYWYNMNVTDYWQAANSPRQEMIKAGAVKVLSFPAGSTQAVMSREDPQWDQWIHGQNAYAVIILCNTPREGPSSAGPGDTRRRILYTRRSVRKPSSVRLQISPAGMMELAG